MKTQQYLVKNLQGLLQRVDFDQGPANYSPLLINISLDKPGTWSKRSGAKILGGSATSTSGGTLGGGYYNANVTGSRALHVFRSYKLQKYNEGSDSYADLDSTILTNASNIQTTNYLNRLYFLGTNVPLSYESGGTFTVVGGGGSEVYGDSICSAQNSLFISSVSKIGAGAVNYQDRTYYSLFDNTNNTPTHQLYNPSETISTSTRWFTVNAPTIGVFSFGVTGLCYTFTKERCFSFDLRYEQNATGVQPVFGIGLLNKRTICECNGMMVWFDSLGRGWGWGGAGAPAPITWDLEDDENKEAVINILNFSNLSEFASGSIGNKFYFSLGDITYKGEFIQNAVLKGLVSQNKQVILYAIDSYPFKFTWFANANIGGKEVLVGGTKINDDIYIINSGSNDGGTAISATAKTMFLDFGLPFSTKDLIAVYIKYRPQPNDPTFLRIRYAVDGNYRYEILSDPDSYDVRTDGRKQFGTINMYNEGENTRNTAIKKMNFPSGTNCRNISLELGNLQLNQDFEVSAILFEYTVRDLDIRIDG